MLDHTLRSSLVDGAASIEFSHFLLLPHDVQGKNPKFVIQYTRRLNVGSNVRAMSETYIYIVVRVVFLIGHQQCSTCGRTF